MSHREISINGLSFAVPQPYAEGHTISAAEAHTLNQTYAENIRNNGAAIIKKHLKTGEVEKLEALGHEALAAVRSEVEKYAAEYTFSGATRGPRAPVDPVAREATKIASEIVRTKLREKNVAVKDLPEGRFDAFVAALLEKQPAIRDEAERRVAASKEVADSLLDDMVG